MREIEMERKREESHRGSYTGRQKEKIRRREWQKLKNERKRASKIEGKTKKRYRQIKKEILLQLLVRKNLWTQLE